MSTGDRMTPTHAWNRRLPFTLPLTAATALTGRAPSDLAVARPELYFWELVEVSRKLGLTGFIFLIPQANALMRVVMAMLVGIAHAVLVAVAAPYKHPSTHLFAIAASVTMQCTVFIALLVKVEGVCPPPLVCLLPSRLPCDGS